MQPIEMIKDGLAAVTSVLSAGQDDNEPKNPIALLTSQHREAEALFAEILGASERAYKQKEKALGTLIEKLVLHTELEEKLFYPSAKAVATDFVLESFEEHGVVKILLRKLIGADARDESFKARVTVLEEIIHHHVREEEAELFPQCKAKISDEVLDDIGAKMQAYIAAQEARGQKAAPPRRQPALKAAAKRAKKAPAKKAAAVRGKRTRH